MRELFKVETRGVPRSSSSRGNSLSSTAMAWETKLGNMLAIADGCYVHIWDRHGEHMYEIASASNCNVIHLEWDREGTLLAIMQEGQGVIQIWDSEIRETSKIETNLKDPSFMQWSKVGPQLVIGTSKGNVIVYNSRTREVIPIMGKHPRRISCGAWSKENRLALGSEDRTLTLSNELGDTTEQTELKFAATEMEFATQKPEDSKTPSSKTNTKRIKKQHLNEPTSKLPETHLSINMGGDSLLLYDLNDPDNPLELAFQEKYGSIITHRWFGDGLMMLGFAEGYLVVISTHMSEIGEELFSGKFHSRSLYDVSYSPSLKMAAVSGDSGIKLVDMVHFKDHKREAVQAQLLGRTNRGARATKLKWSPDGQILSAATDDGCVHCFLAKLPLLHASHHSRLVYLSSLRDISILQLTSDGEAETELVVTLDSEPSILALGPQHVAVGFQSTNTIAYYSTKDGRQQKLNEQTYAGDLQTVKLNSKFTAVLAGSKIILHEMDDASAQHFKFPPDSADPDRAEATAIGLTENLLIFGTRAGTIELFSLLADDMCLLSAAELRHSTPGPIRELSPNASGTRLAFVDAAGAGHIYNAASIETAPIPAFPTPNATSKKNHAEQPAPRIIWDSTDRHVFYVCGADRELHTYVYAPTTVKGAAVSKLGPVEISADGEVRLTPKATPLQSGLIPVCACEGSIACQGTAGGLSFVQSPVYEHKASPGGELAFSQTLALLKLSEAWNAALELNARAYWLALSNKAMELIEVQLAIRVYRQLGDAGMVAGLERVAHHEDKNLLAGHVLLLFGNYNGAQELFLSSSRPVSALEMRRDLLHWDQALKLANTLDPSQLPFISVEYAQQLEFKTEYSNALKMFQSALDAFTDGHAIETDGDSKMDDLDGDIEEKKDNCIAEAHTISDPAEILTAKKACTSGVARCTLRLGDLRRGIALVKEARSERLSRECAGILENMSQYAEAAAMYEAGDFFEKAAAIYISQHNFEAAAAIMHKVTLPKLHLQYAKACETAGKVLQAAAAYEAAGDLDSVVRLYLHQLEKPEKALEIVRRTHSSGGAQLVARFCQQEGDFRGAIEFLLMAQRSEEAFELSKAHGHMELYTSVLGDQMTPDDALNVARHYESVHEPGLAGKFYAVCGQYAKALKLYMSCGESQLNSAIEIVGKARSDTLTHKLIDYLMGEPDGVPKDPNYIYRLYIALGNFPQAARTAVIIARQEQELGSYKQAHAVLYETNIKLIAHGVRVPQSLRQAFILLHSYMLVMKKVKQGDHESAARLLLRVAKNISKFPSHVAPLLTTTVVECQRAGLKVAAYEYALMLMRPEHRNNVDAQFRRKIEAMIRRPGSRPQDGESDPSEPETPCPISNLPLARFKLECPTTKEEIPMCVVTGRHMEKDDWCICPNSKMPALFSEYRKYIQAELSVCSTAAIDPVCGKPISLDRIQRASSTEIEKALRPPADEDNSTANATMGKSSSEPSSKSSKKKSQQNGHATNANRRSRDFANGSSFTSAANEKNGH